MIICDGKIVNNEYYITKGPNWDYLKEGLMEAIVQCLVEDKMPNWTDEQVKYNVKLIIDRLKVFGENNNDRD